MKQSVNLNLKSPILELDGSLVKKIDKVKNPLHENGTPKSVEELKEIADQQVINNRFNARGEQLSEILTSKLTECDITFCHDGCLVVSCDNTQAEIEQLIQDEGLEIQPDRSEIRHRIKSVDPKDPESESHQDIDEIFEPASKGETKLLTSSSRINMFKQMSAP